MQKYTILIQFDISPPPPNLARILYSKEMSSFSFLKSAHELNLYGIFVFVLKYEFADKATFHAYLVDITNQFEKSIWGMVYTSDVRSEYVKHV